MKPPRFNDSYIRRKCGLVVLTVQEATSTHDLVKAYAAQGAPAGTALVAGTLTGAARPAGSELYMSVLLRPSLSEIDRDGIAAAAVLAAAEAAEEVSGKGASLFWPCGIACQDGLVGKTFCSFGFVESDFFAVASVRFLLHAASGEPADFDPAAILPSVGLFSEKFSGKYRYAREELAIAFYRQLRKRVETPAALYTAYRDRLWQMGRQGVLDTIPVTVTGLDRVFRLELTLPDKTTVTLSGDNAARLAFTPSADGAKRFSADA